jgi:NIMA (never in mitosis gene a)-related kinase
MSPEQIEENRYNEKSDIWSLGCFLYELATFNPPFEATNHLSLALKIKSAKVERIGNRYSEELARIIMWMLCTDQERRPSCEDMLNIPQVSLRLRERRLKEHTTKLKKFDESLNLREKELNERERNIEIRIKALIEKEEKLSELEKKLTEREKNTNPLSVSHKRNTSIEKNSSNYINVNVSLNKYDDIFSQRLKVIDNNYQYDTQEYNTINSNTFIPKRPELNDTSNSFTRFDPSVYKIEEKQSIKKNIYKMQTTRGKSYSRLATPQNKSQENSDIYTKYTTLRERISSSPNIKQPVNINKPKTLTISK